MSAYVCVPVLRRYDLLERLLVSLHASTVKPDAVYVIDNGRDEARVNRVLLSASCPVFKYEPPEPLGVAESWNWFINNTDEDRVIVNDDIEFAPTSLEKLLASSADLVWAAGEGFSCFVMRDACVEKVGFFDESISPGYGYYEDEDYLQRLDGRGTLPRKATAENVECGVRHERSSTLRAGTHEEILAHHRKFKIAQSNYMKKWRLTTI